MNTFKTYLVFDDRHYLRFGFYMQPTSLDAAWNQTQEEFGNLLRMAKQHTDAEVIRIGIEELNDKGHQVANRVVNIRTLSTDDSLEERRRKLGADADLAEFFDEEIV